MLNIQTLNLIASYSYEKTFKKLRCLNRYTHKYTKKQSILRYLHKLKLCAKNQSFLNKKNELKFVLYPPLLYREPITNKNIIKYKPYQPLDSLRRGPRFIYELKLGHSVP
jgi:hypothetical protein